MKRLFATVAIAAAPCVAMATPITGTLNLTGNGGVTFSSTQAIFSDSGNGNVTATNQVGSFADVFGEGGCLGCVTFAPGTSDGKGDTVLTYDPLPTGGSLVYSVASGNNSSTLKLTDITFAGEKNGAYMLQGTGIMTLTGYDPTEGNFSLTTQTAKTMASFSATSYSVPEPNSFLMLGFGVALLGLGFASRRRLG